MRLTREQQSEQPRKEKVDHPKKSAHSDNCHDDHAREVDGFFARWPNHLAEFRARFPEVPHDSIISLNFSDHRQLLIRDRLRTNQDTVRLRKTVSLLLSFRSERRASIVKRPRLPATLIWSRDAACAADHGGSTF